MPDDNPCPVCAAIERMLDKYAPDYINADLVARVAVLMSRCDALWDVMERMTSCEAYAFLFAHQRRELNVVDGENKGAAHA